MHACLKMAEVWFENAKDIWFHDPLAASLIFHPELCNLETGNVEIGFGNDDAQGSSPFVHQVPGHHRVAVSVDQAKFFDDYYRVTGCK